MIRLHSILSAATIFLILIFYSGIAAPENDAGDVVVFNLSGKVEVLSAGSADDGWVDAAQDAKLRSGDKIRTGDGAFAELSFNEDQIVRVGPMSTAVIWVKNGEKLELVDGEIYATVDNLPSGSSFEIRTPAGLSGARGTDWLTRVGNEEMVVESYSGKPFVRNIEQDGTVSREETIILPGFRTNVAKFQKPVAQIRVPEARMKEWINWKEQVRPRVSEAVKRQAIRPNEGRMINRRPGGNKPGRLNKPAAGDREIGRSKSLEPGMRKQAPRAPSINTQRPGAAKPASPASLNKQNTGRTPTPNKPVSVKPATQVRKR